MRPAALRPQVSGNYGVLKKARLEEEHGKAQSDFEGITVATVSAHRYEAFCKLLFSESLNYTTKLQ